MNVKQILTVKYSAVNLWGAKEAVKEKHISLIRAISNKTKYNIKLYEWKGL